MANRFGVTVPKRLEDLYATHQYKETVKKWDYCVVNQFGQVEEVFCKRCGDRVMGLRDWGDPEVYHAQDKLNTMVVRQKVRVMPYNNYAMLLIQMDDGSSHLTVSCTTCCDEMRALTPEQLQDYYVADLASLTDTATTTRDLDVVDKLFARKPKRVL